MILYFFCTIRWLRGCKVVNGITGQTCLNCFNWQFNIYKGLAGSGQCRARRQSWRPMLCVLYISMFEAYLRTTHIMCCLACFLYFPAVRFSLYYCWRRLKGDLKLWQYHICCLSTVTKITKDFLLLGIKIMFLNVYDDFMYIKILYYKKIAFSLL